MAERNERELRGGTEGGEVARQIDPEMKSEGTPGHTAPSGGTHVEPPSRAVPRTGMAQRPTEGVGLLAGGKAPDQVMSYLGDLTFPAKKDAVIRAARRNGAPEDVLAALGRLGQTEYAGADDLIRDYPRLPDEAGPWPREDVNPSPAVPGRRPAPGS